MNQFLAMITSGLIFFVTNCGENGFQRTDKSKSSRSATDTAGTPAPAEQNAIAPNGPINVASKSITIKVKRQCHGPKFADALLLKKDPKLLELETVALKLQDANGVITVFTSRGKEYRQEIIDSGKITLNPSEVPLGIYKSLLCDPKEARCLDTASFQPLNKQFNYHGSIGSGNVTVVADPEPSTDYGYMTIEYDHYKFSNPPGCDWRSP